MLLPGIRLAEYHYTTEGNENQGGVASLLLPGLENAISARDLATLSGCDSDRQLRHRIARERAQGALILSSAQGGYFLPAAGKQGREELRAYIRTLYAHALNTMKAARAAKQALDRWEV